jgi:hypothetical protein
MEFRRGALRTLGAPACLPNFSLTVFGEKLDTQHLQNYIEPLSSKKGTYGRVQQDEWGLRF